MCYYVLTANLSSHLALTYASTLVSGQKCVKSALPLVLTLTKLCGLWELHAAFMLNHSNLSSILIHHCWEHEQQNKTSIHSLTYRGTGSLVPQTHTVPLSSNVGKNQENNVRDLFQLLLKTHRQEIVSVFTHFCLSVRRVREEVKKWQKKQWKLWHSPACIKDTLKSQWTKIWCVVLLYHRSKLLG